MNFKPRWEIIADFINEHGYRNIAEVGVNKCETVDRVLVMCPYIKNYHLIDINKTPEIESTLRLNPKTRFYNRSSALASICLTDESLDLVFIDADHTYEAVKKDISLWLPKIRIGGMITGHDYHKTGNIPHNGVKQAVDEKFDNVNLTSDECLQSDRCVWWEYKYV